MALEVGHVFHRHDFRLQLLHQPSELAQQVPLLVRPLVYSLRVLGKRCARRAANQYTTTSGWIMFCHRLASKFGNTLLKKFCSRVIMFVREFAITVDVVTSHDFYSGIE